MIINILKIYLLLTGLVFILIFTQTSESLKISKSPVQVITVNQKLVESSPEFLSKYIQINTMRKDEHKASLYFQKLFKKHGIKSKILMMPGSKTRSILVAEIGENAAGKKGLILAGHSDVVEVEPKDWNIPPFSGLIKDGIIHGRGSLDMKALSVMHAYSFIWLKKNITKFNRKFMFLLLPGEESGGDGARLMTSKYKDYLSDYEYMLNEGAVISDGVAVENLKIVNIQFAEKGIFWFKALSKGSSGHGSTPIPNYASKNLIKFITWMQKTFNKRELTPNIEKFLYQLGTKAPALQAFFLKRSNNSLIKLLLEPTFTKSRHLNAMTSNTMSITGLRTYGDDGGINVISGNAMAKFDMRTLPGLEVDELEKIIRAKAKELDITIKVEFKNNATYSSIDNEFFNMLANLSGKVVESSVVTPLMSPGATDNAHFRAFGLKSYGFYPAIVTGPEISTMHGINEYMSIKNLKFGIHTMSLVVNEFNRL
jgi:acetylornithine deacetylase/succinyl-diaminopimelate desuccinylase-like protein